MSTAKKLLIAFFVLVSVVALGGYPLLPTQADVAASGVSLARSLKGHGSWVYTTTFSPDNTLLASGDGEGVVKVWEVSSGREIRTLRVAGGEQFQTLEDLKAQLVGQVRFTADGKQLITATRRSVKLWDLTSGVEVRSLADAAYPFAVTADGQTMVSAYRSAKLAVWHLGEGRLVRTLHGCGKQPGAVAVAPSGAMAACGTFFGEYTVRLLDAQSGKEIGNMGGERGATKATLGLQFSKDGRMLAASNADKAVVVFEVPTGRELGRYAFDPGKILYVETADMSSDLRWLATEEAGGAISLIELPTKRPRVLIGHQGQTGGFSYSSDGGWFASSGGRDRVVKLWKLPPPDSLATGWPK